MNLRIGHGYDAHRLVENRPLILGGVKIQYDRGLLGHSDADVLTHAVMDSILGALALEDIGAHFPDSDPQYKNANSIVLLEKVYGLMEAAGYQLGNLDATLIAQEPKLKPYLIQMKENLAGACHTRPENVSIKATTEEKMGFTGSGEGIAAHCVCLLIKSE